MPMKISLGNKDPEPGVYLRNRLMLEEPGAWMNSEHSPDAPLIASLARLWPNREHESSAVAGLLCRVGVHYWRRLDTSQLAPGRDVRFCFWCSKIELDGIIHNP